MNSHWNSLIKRIQSESYRCNGEAKSGSKKLNSISQITVRIALHDGCPVMWEVAGSCKAEPMSLIESLANVSHSIRQLSELCESPEQVEAVLGRLIDSLSKSN